MDTRTDNILNIGEAFTNLNRLKFIIEGIVQQIKATDEHITIFQAQKAELEAALEAKRAEVIEETQCIDRALGQLYPAGTNSMNVPAEAPEKKRGRKPKETPVEAAPEVKVEPAPEPEQAADPTDRHECPCGEIFYGAEAYAAHTATCKDYAANLAAGGDVNHQHDDNPSHQEQEDAADQFVREITEAEQSAHSAVSYEPLVKPHGNCELCAGLGVIEGELYGEPTLVPCNCSAGKIIKGEKPGEDPEIKKCCEDCNIEDPDCASCHTPDMDAPFDPDPSALPRCASGPCTATGKKPKDTCLRVQGKECKNFVPVENCKHWVHKQTKNEDGTVTCDLCDAVLEAKAEPEEQPASPLQTKCPHPKPFRIQTDEGEVCKVCKANLSQPGLFAAA